MSINRTDRLVSMSFKHYLFCLRRNTFFYQADAIAESQDEELIMWTYSQPIAG